MDRPNREQLQAILEGAKAQEKEAVAEASQFLKSDEAKAFVDKITSLRDRTMPGNVFDQVLTSLIGSVSSISTMLDKVVADAANLEAVAAAKTAATPAAPAAE